MDFHWDWGCDTLFEPGHGCSDLLPPAGSIVQILHPPHFPYQVTWLGAARSTTQDFKDLQPVTYDTFDVAVAAVEATVRAAGHTVGGV